MRILAEHTVLLTGASGGLGTFMAQAFAERKVKLALVAHPGIDLEDLRKSFANGGAQAVAVTSDLRDPVQRREMLAAVRSQLGPIDILVNNAGVEFNSAYHELSEGQIGEVLSVNLEAPMILSRLVLPDMLGRRRGHIVNIASLAGKSGPAFQEPYAATKAGLVAFTQSLRATYRGSGVSASVIVPAFVEAGIYARLKAKSGRAAPRLLTGCSPEQVAQAVLRSIEGDVPEIIVSRYPIRPVLALSALSPRLGDWITARMGVNDFFRRAAEAEKRNRS
ncbi:MAG: SDR family NAD(P)-dependent oxidoreductase [Limisphaerales bacterium]